MDIARPFAWLMMVLVLGAATGCLTSADPDDVAEVTRDLEPHEVGTEDSESESNGDDEKSPIPPPRWADSRKAPLNVPLVDVNPDEAYTLGKEDIVMISIDDLKRPDETASFEREITSSGKFSLPMVGDIQAANMTAAELRAGIVRKLSEFIVDPRVSVKVMAHKSKRVMVMGSVNSPGVFAIPKNRVSLLEALSLARGLSKDAGRSAVLTRASRDKRGAVQYLIDLEHLLTKGKPVKQFVLEPGDVLNIPVAEQVYVIGYVHRPGSFPLQRRMTALELVSRSGGWLAYQASPGASFLRRRKPDGNYDIIPLDLEDIVAGKASDVVLIPGDTVVVPQTGLRTFGLESWAVIKGRIPGAPPVYR